MIRWSSYICAQTLEEALDSLTQSPHPCCLVAGGTDLLLEIEQGRHPPVHTLVDVTQVAELNQLEQRAETLWIGAAVPLARLIAWQPLRQEAPALYEAVSLIGGPQVRNVATLGGNVAHALPAADGAIALLALDARVWVASRRGISSRCLLECYAGPGKTALAGDEIILAFELARRSAGEASAFQRVMRPQGVAIAIQNMAVWLRREQDSLADIRIAIGPAGVKPFRASGAEDSLRGKTLEEESIREGVAALLREAHFRTSPHRATAEYRQRLAGVLLRQTLQTAWQRAAQG